MLTPEEAATGWMRALNARDLTTGLALWAPGARQNVRGQVDTTAPGGVRDQMEELFAAVPDARFEVVATTTEGDRCALQWRLAGGFDGRGSLAGVAPTGGRIELEGVDVFTVRDGLIRANDAFSDTMEFARQVGMMPARASLAERAMTAGFNALTRAKRLAARR